MADDRDVDAMLEAPFKKSEPSPPATKSAAGEIDENGHHRNSSRKRSSRSKDERSHKSSSSKSENKKRHRHHRSPSKSHDRKHREGSDRKHHRRHHRSRTPSPGRSQSHHRRSRSDLREKERPTTRPHPRSPVREEPMIPKERSPSPQDRDTRTVLCMQLAQRIGSRDLEDFFSAVGTVRELKFFHSKGIAYVEFKDLESVPLALDLNGRRLLGVPIIVQPSQSEKSKVSGHSWTFLDNEAKSGEQRRRRGRIGMNGRLQLMAKLAEGTGLEVPSTAQQALWLGQSMGVGLPGNASGGAAGGATEAGINGGNAPPIATTCFQLSNMFDPTKEIGDDWDKEIADDVIEECQRHGDVMHVYVDKKSLGNVYVKCGDCDGAAKSVASLNGRYFAGNVVTAAYVPLGNYHSLFPDAGTTPLKPLNR